MCHFKVICHLNLKPNFYVAVLKERWYIGIALSVCPSRKRNIAYNFAISSYFFIKLSIYIAYDNTDTMMPKTLCQGHIYQSFAHFVN